MPESDKSTSTTSHFSRDVLTLVTGTTISQIITILSAPIITRLYGPEAYGLLAVFTSITSIIGVIVCLRYELAIMLPKSDEEAANVFGLCILIIFVMSILSIPLITFSQQSFEGILKSSQIGDFFWLIPPSIFLSGMFLALNYWNTRTKQFNRLAVAQVMRTGSYSGIQLGFGFIGYATGGILIGATLIGQLMATFVLGIQIMRDHLSFFRQNITANGMITVFKLYSNFPKYDIWAALLNAINLTLPVFILTAFFNSTIVGYYALGLMVLQFPLSFIVGAISQVFFQKAAEAKNISHQKLKETVLQTIKPLNFVAFSLVFLFILIGPEIFSVIFGEKWEVSGNYVRFLSLWVGIQFISTPISSLFSIFQKQRFALILNIFQLTIQGGALIIGGLTGNALTAIILYGFVTFFSYGVAYFYLLRFSGISILTPVKIVSNFFLFSVPFILCILVFKSIFSANSPVIVLLSVTIFMFFPVLMIKRDPEISSVLKGALAQIPVIKGINKYL